MNLYYYQRRNSSNAKPNANNTLGPHFGTSTDIEYVFTAPKFALSNGLLSDATIYIL